MSVIQCNCIHYTIIHGIFSIQHNRSDIYEWFQLLSQEHPSKIEVTTIGRTYSDREIIAVKISDGASTTNSHEKPKIYLQCLLHAS